MSDSWEDDDNDDRIDPRDYISICDKHVNVPQQTEEFLCLKCTIIKLWDDDEN